MSVLARNWWVVALRGVIAVLFGLAALFWPLASLLALVLLFGAYALIDGVLSAVSAVRAARRHERWGALLAEGVVGILAGAVTLLWPGIGALALVYVIAAWALITGALEIGAAIRLRKEIEGEWLLGVSGGLSIVFGLLLAAYPGTGALAVVWIIGAYALLFGVLLIALGVRLRGRQRGSDVPTGSAAHAGA